VELNLKNIALTFVPSMSDAESEVKLNKVNPNVENTIIIFKQRNIIAKFINLKPSTDSFQIVSTKLDKSTGDYFNLPEPEHQ
jgi:protocatechuate 3,4-dioxygenase beta subunit